jgi:hypothetical protein
MASKTPLLSQRQLNRFKRSSITILLKGRRRRERPRKRRRKRRTKISAANSLR